VEGHSDGATEVGWANQNMMTANDPIDHEPGLSQRCEHLPGVNGR
jgi:hypothetical protein